MDIQLIAMDLDGTTLRSDHKTFSPRLLAALEAAHRRDVQIAPVTGRQYGLLPDFLRSHPVWENLAVLANGAQIRDLGTGELYHRLDISEEALRQLLALATKYELPMEFSVDSTLHLTKRDYDSQLPYPKLAFHRDVILANHGRIWDKAAILLEL